MSWMWHYPQTIWGFSEPKPKKNHLYFPWIDSCRSKRWASWKIIFLPLNRIHFFVIFLVFFGGWWCVENTLSCLADYSELHSVSEQVGAHRLAPSLFDRAPSLLQGSRQLTLTSHSAAILGRFPLICTPNFLPQSSHFYSPWSYSVKSTPP